MTVQVILSTPGSGTYTIPSGWASAVIEVIGGGAGGYQGLVGTYYDGGGGGGGYSSSGSIVVVAGTVCNYHVGAGGTGGASSNTPGGVGGDSWFALNNTATSITSSGVVSGAKGGISSTGTTNGTGGQASSGIGSTKYSGGLGVGPFPAVSPTESHSSGGGGGAAGPNGNGGNGGWGGGTTGSFDGGGGGGNGGGGGGASSSLSGVSETGVYEGGANYAFAGAGGPPATNGNGNNGTVGGGGGPGNGTGQGGNGGNGTEWTTVGSGGGGGSSGCHAPNTGGNGGLYGGGGGGAFVQGPTPGNGAQGIIILTGTLAAPGIPTGLTVSNPTNSTLTLSWTPASGAAADSYTLQYRLDPAGSWIQITGITGPSFVVTGLAALTSYDFEVEAINVVGNSGFSSEVVGTTLATGYNPFPNPTPVFPTLSPLTWSIHKKPILSSRSTVAITGRGNQLACAAYPRWAFTLSYGGGNSWLREQTQNITPDPRRTGQTELQQISSLWLACLGPYGEFFYSDPDDNSRSSQFVEVGDGTTITFPLYYSWGSGPFTPSMTIPVGGIQTIDAVYFNGVLQSSSSYSLDASFTQLVFTSAPSSGVVITTDFHFYFLCRFLDDEFKWSQWAENLWDIKEVRFESVKT